MSSEPIVRKRKIATDRREDKVDASASFTTSVSDDDQFCRATVDLVEVLLRALIIYFQSPDLFLAHRDRLFQLGNSAFDTMDSVTPRMLLRRRSTGVPVLVLVGPGTKSKEVEGADAVEHFYSVLGSLPLIVALSRGPKCPVTGAIMQNGEHDVSKN
jgi:hypothetical protein